MTRYQVTLSSNDNRIQFSEEFEATDDATALRVVRQILADHPRYHGYELWRGRRLVQRQLGRVDIARGP